MSTGFLCPVPGAKVSSGFGPREDVFGSGAITDHCGVDFAVSEGTPVRAAADGVVKVAKEAGTYGNLIRLTHDGAYETRYGHLSEFAVEPGTQVRAGDVIGYSGSTGRSTGPHLHYEVRRYGKALDPMNAAAGGDLSMIPQEAL